MIATIEIPDEIVPEGMVPVRYGLCRDGDCLWTADGSKTCHKSALSAIHFRHASQVNPPPKKENVGGNWITDRLPTEKDAPHKGKRVLAVVGGGIVMTQHFTRVFAGQPWQPLPEIACIS